MSECKLNHSLDDVRKKLGEQANFLPSEIYRKLNSFLNDHLSQEKLNVTFHYLKKYDLAPTEEREERNNKMRAMLP
jgi:hypothetical protein